MEREKDVNETVTQGIEGSQSKILGTAESPVLPFKDRGFLDKEEAKKEHEALKLHIASIRRNVFKYPPKITSREATRWNRLTEQLTSSLDLSQFVEEELNQVALNPTNYSYRRLSRLYGMGIGVGLLQEKKIWELFSLSRKYSVSDEYHSLTKLMEFSSSTALSISVGSIALRDFMSIDKKSTNPTPYYKFLVELGFNDNNSRQQIFEENQEYPKNIYPNLTKRAIIDASNNLTAIVNPYPFSTEELEDSTLQESLRLFNSLARKVKDIQDKSYQTVLDPTSNDFAELSMLVSQYLDSKDREVRIGSLYTLNLVNKQRIIEAYRKARKYEREDNNGEFYMIFGDSISEYIEEASSSINVLTDEDIVTILDADKVQSGEEKSEPTFEQLGKRVNDILNRTSNRDFDINPSDIDWSQLHVPQEAQIYFDANRPRKFTVKIAFDNELGESTEVECVLDTTKNFMDWNHPEDPMALPDNPDLIAFRGSLLVAAQSILNNVYAQAQAEYQLKLQSRDTSSQTVVQRPKRERAQDPVYQLRKDTRALQREESFNQGSLFEVLTQKEEVKNRVILPEEEEFEDLAAFLSHVDREIVRRSIEEYNEKGTGAKFRRKKRSGSEGEPIYGLSIGCTVPKGARVLLREAESEAGTRNFEIIDIRYRKDVYSKNKL